jgi:hypothetical protein
MPPRILALIVTGSLLLMGTGCHPVVWTADSSGFVWAETDPERSVLFHYDIASGKSKILVTEAPAMAPWPALSPDAKRIAVGRLTASKEKSETMQLILYSLQGKELQRSAELPWAKGRTDDEKLQPTAAFWGPGDTLLVHDFADTREGHGKQVNKTGICDLHKKTSRLLDGSPMTIAGTPIRPDGKGFLMCRPDKGSLDIFFVQWDGTEYKINMGPGSRDNREMLQTPWKCDSEWRGALAIIRSGTSSVLIDTEKKTGTFAAIDRPDDGGSILQRFAFSEGACELQVVAVKGVSGQRRLELIKKGEKTPKVIHVGKAPRGHAPGDDFFLSPSPNRQWIAVRIFYDEAQQGRVLLINARGEVRDIQARTE